MIHLRAALHSRTDDLGGVLNGVVRCLGSSAPFLLLYIARATLYTSLHALLLFRNDEELEKARAAVHRMVHRAIALEGTCTGEHGVGMGKREYLVEELGEGTVELMKRIKRTIDPYNLFNPGKVSAAFVLCSASCTDHYVGCQLYPDSSTASKQ